MYGRQYSSQNYGGYNNQSVYSTDVDNRHHHYHDDDEMSPDYDDEMDKDQGFSNPSFTSRYDSVTHPHDYPPVAQLQSTISSKGSRVFASNVHLAVADRPAGDGGSFTNSRRTDYEAGPLKLPNQKPSKGSSSRTSKETTNTRRMSTGSSEILSLSVSIMVNIDQVPLSWPDDLKYV